MKILLVITTLVAGISFLTNCICLLIIKDIGARLSKIEMENNIVRIQKTYDERIKLEKEQDEDSKLAHEAAEIKRQL